MPAANKPKARASMTTSHMKMLHVASASLRNVCAFAGRPVAMDRSADRITILTLPVSVVAKCHSAHRFSRRAQQQCYRNLIYGLELPPVEPCAGRNRNPLTPLAVIGAGYARQSRPSRSSVRRALAPPALPGLIGGDRRTAPFPPALMTSLFPGPSLRLVFKWHFDHLGG